jgi:hypothetical protein
MLSQMTPLHSSLRSVFYYYYTPIAVKTSLYFTLFIRASYFYYKALRVIIIIIIFITSYQLHKMILFVSILSVVYNNLYESKLNLARGS